MTQPNFDLSAALLRELVGTEPWMQMAMPPAPAQYMYICVHMADDSEETDILVVTTADDALAERTNAAGNPVWRRIGTLAHVLGALRDLPPPGHPDAPKKEFRKGSPDDRPL